MMAYIAMAYIAMTYIVMAYSDGLYSYGRYSDGLCSLAAPWHHKLEVYRATTPHSVRHTQYDAACIVIYDNVLKCYV